MPRKYGGGSPIDIAIRKADLVPMVDSLDHFEVRIHLEASELNAGTVLYRPLAEHLGESIGFRLPKSKHGANYKLAESWEGSLDEAFELARHNLDERAHPFSETGRLYSIMSDGVFSVSHMLLKDRIRDLNVPGDKIAVVPDHRTLHICGSEDADSLAAMAHLAGEDLRHKETISGMAFRLGGDDWEPWLPPVDHPSFANFKELNLWTVARAYHDQKDLFDSRNVCNEPPFVASFSNVKHPVTGQKITYSLWTEGVPTLLPQTDLVLFSRHKARLIQPIGGAEWKTVHGLVGHLMELQDMYPTRYLVREFPDSGFLKQLRHLQELLDPYRP